MDNLSFLNHIIVKTFGQVCIVRLSLNVSDIYIRRWLDYCVLQATVLRLVERGGIF